jgi:diacylglycerol kinase (ATP)
MPQPWVAIQRNPSSGSGKQAGIVIDLIRSLKALGIQPRLYSRREEFDAAVREPARRESLIGVVAAGGDGTVFDLINRHPDLPICVLPLGTENLLAKAFQIPRCGRSVARIIAEGHRQRIDAGWINGRRFLIMASAGFDAEVVHHLHAVRRGRHVRHWTYIRPILDALFPFKPQKLRITVDNQPTVYEGELAVVANLRAYALNLGVVPTACGTDGMLDARVFRARSLWELLAQFARILTGRHERCPSVIPLQGKTMRIESDVPVPIQVDGDPAGVTPVEIRVEPLAVEFILPRSVR